MMAVTIASAKKLQADFNVAQYYSYGLGRGGAQHLSVSSALSAFEHAGGTFDASERVLRFTEGSFDLNPVSTAAGAGASSFSSVPLVADWTLLRILAKLHREGWAFMGSANISGKDKATVTIGTYQLLILVHIFLTFKPIHSCSAVTPFS